SYSTPVIGIARSGADGRYEIRGMPASDARVLVEGAGMRNATVPAPPPPTHPARRVPPLPVGWTVVLRPDRRSTLDLDVLPGAVARGVVRDAGGAPVAGAVVRVGPGGENPNAY